jgi:hypothetical protein
MASINSSKQGVDFAKKEIIPSPQTAGYTVTTSWANIGGGFSITVNEDGLYRITALFTMFLDYTAQTNQQGKARFAVNGVAVPNSIIACSREMPGGSDKARHPFTLSKILSLVDGDVVTVQAWKGTSDPVSIMYTASSFEGGMEAELLSAYVNAYDSDKIYSTTEINTGKIWTDGKPIYRRVWTGTTGAGVTSTLALGITVDTVIAPITLKIDSSTYGWQGPEGSGNMNVYFTNTTQDDITLYHNAAHLQSRPYFIVIEYTK